MHERRYMSAVKLQSSKRTLCLQSLTGILSTGTLCLMSRSLLPCLFSLLVCSLQAAEADPDIKALMTAGELHATGIDSLSPDQINALNA